MASSVHGTTRARTTLRRLQRRISSGEWPLNSQIPTEAELSAELEVGRSTIREAVRTLANMGMLEPARGRGTFVRSLSPVPSLLSDFMEGHSPGDLLETRRALEIEAVRLATEHCSETDLTALRRAHAADIAVTNGEVAHGVTPGQFHALLLRASGNRLLIDLHGATMAGLRRAIDKGQVVPGIEAGTRHTHHEQLLEALAAGDLEQAAAAAALHLHADLVLPSSDD